jgi:uncharacterized protein YjbI with pentapeptide repeats
MTALAAIAATLGALALVLIAFDTAARAKATARLPPWASATRQRLDGFALTRGVPVWVVWLFGFLWSLLFLTFVAGLLWVIGHLLWHGPALTAEDAPDYRWHLLTLTALTAALGAVVALPFTLLRTGYAARQTRTAEENLTTDLINKAVEGLGAQKEVNRLGRTVRFADENDRPDSIFELKGTRESDETVKVTHVADWQNITQTVPNIEVRFGAIYALERIAQDSDRDHVRIMEILCAYIRQNAPASGAQPNPLGRWPDYPEDTNQEVLKERGEKLDARKADREAWIKHLQDDHAPRADIQAAMKVIGRRTDHQRALEQQRKHRQSDEPYRLDLRKTNLQAADLSKLNFARALLNGSHLEGSNLTEARLEGANLSDAKLVSARLDLANLGKAGQECAILTKARLEGANLFGALLKEANLAEARLEDANLRSTPLEIAHLRKARLERANLDWAQMEGAYLGEARLEGTSLEAARLEGVNFSGASLSKETSLRLAFLRGAGFQAIDLSIPRADFLGMECSLGDAFGDASVTLPEGLKAGAQPLEHWSTERLDWPDFQEAWRAHQCKIGYRPPD